jgi:enoyl-CoA hydratase/carnithine racemase
MEAILRMALVGRHERLRDEAQALAERIVSRPTALLRAAKRDLWRQLEEGP